LFENDGKLFGYFDICKCEIETFFGDGCNIHLNLMPNCLI